MQLQQGFLVKYLGLWENIKQHQFILSDKIDAYYYDNATKEGLLEVYKSFISDISGTDQTLEIADKDQDINKNISNFFKNKCKSLAIVICEKNELNINHRSCKYQYTIDEAYKDRNGPLGMYSIKALFSADVGENARIYINWIKNIMSNEKEVSFIDKYLLQKEKNFNCLVNYYYPIIPRGCVLNLHVLASSLFIDQAIKEAERANVCLKIHKYRRMKHDRHITTSDRIITIGVGLDFMCQMDGRIVMRERSFFAMDEKDEESSYMELEKSYAGYEE